MKKVPVFLAVFLIFVFASINCFAIDTARSFGMAGAVVALSNDLSAPYYNPACLVNVKNGSLALSMSSKNILFKMSDTESEFGGTVSSPFNNLGYAYQSGRWVFCLGSATNLNSIYSGTLQASGSDIELSDSYLIQGMGMSFAIKAQENLAIGSSINLLSAHHTFSGNIDESIFFEGEDSGLAAGINLGILYNYSHDTDFGASLLLLGGMAEKGFADISGTLYEEFDLNAYGETPSRLKFGAGYHPNERLNIGFQAEVFNGFDIEHIRDYESDTTSEYTKIKLTGDTVIGQSLGIEYLMPAGEGVVPLWLGVAYTPSNNFGIEITQFATMLASMNLIRYGIPETTTLSLGVGYQVKDFEVGIAMQEINGNAILSGDLSGHYDQSETKVLLSGTWWI